MTMNSPSKLNKLVAELLPGLVREMGAVQDMIQSAERKLNSVPKSLLHNGSRRSLDITIDLLDQANDSLINTLKILHGQYHAPHAKSEE